MQKTFLLHGEVLNGVSQLLDDFQKLVDDQETADVVFLLGREEEKIYAHRLILMTRCKSFQVCISGMMHIKIILIICGFHYFVLAIFIHI